MSEHIGTVTSIFRYPVKSMLGEGVESSWADDRGLYGDRALAVVDCETGKIASAKNPRLWKRLLACRAHYEQIPKVSEPLPTVLIELPSGDVLASDDPATKQRLSDYLCRPVELLRQAPPSSSYEDYWPDIDGLSPEGHRDKLTVEPIARLAPDGTFFDMSAFHVLTQQSLAAACLAAPKSLMTHARFRPNVLMHCQSEDATFVENGWTGRTLRIGEEVVLRILMPSMRCVMTTLAQPDLPNDPGILRSLVRVNMVDIPNLGKYPCVGVYAGLSRSLSRGGEIAVGDRCFLFESATTSPRAVV